LILDSLDTLVPLFAIPLLGFLVVLFLPKDKVREVSLFFSIVTFLESLRL